ncbi:MAG: sigma-70 family RNA polymerase sigma factor [Ignavibacteriota bacterium]
MVLNDVASFTLIVRKLFRTFRTKYPSIGTDNIFDAIEDGVESLLNYPKEEPKRDEKQTLALLYTFSNRRLIDGLTKSKRKKTESIEQLREKGIDLISTDDFQQTFFTNETLKTMLSALNADERALLELRMAKTPFEEIAKMTGQKKNTLEKRYTRIILKLSRFAENDGMGTNAKSTEITIPKHQAKGR